jgi:hypothetical protein
VDDRLGAWNSKKGKISRKAAKPQSRKEDCSESPLATRDAVLDQATLRLKT